MTWPLTALGALLVLLALRDVFHTLFFPQGFGGLARAAFRVVWKAQKPLNRGSRSSQLGGPVGLLLAFLAWTGLVVLGFALVYWPRMPEGFHYGSPLDPQLTADLPAALYVSLVALATLGLGDVMPADGLLRLVVPVEALCGFVLLTAGISWVLQLYPALTRRRSLALRLAALGASDAVSVVRSGEASVAAGLLDSLAADLATVEVDLVQYGESYFFREESASQSLAGQVHVLAELADAGAQHPRPEVRQAAAALGVVLEELVATLARDFVPGPEGRDEVLHAFREDHQHRDSRQA